MKMFLQHLANDVFPSVVKVIKMVMVSVASSHAKLRTDEAFHIESGGQDMGIMSVCEAPHTDTRACLGTCKFFRICA